MRHLITFILRVWSEAEPGASGWEGQVECVATGERAHVRGEADVARFVESHVAQAAVDEALGAADQVDQTAKTGHQTKLGGERL